MTDAFPTDPDRQRYSLREGFKEAKQRLCVYRLRAGAGYERYYNQIY